MKRVVSVSLGPSADDYVFDATFRGDPYRIRRIGTDGSAERARELLLELDDGQADALGLCNSRVPYAIGSPGELKRQEQISRRLTEGLSTPVTTGDDLRKIGQEWTIRHLQFAFGDNYFDNTRALFLSGRIQYHLAKVLGEYTGNLVFADPLVEHGCPRLLRSLAALERYAASPSGRLLHLPGRGLTDRVRAWRRRIDGALRKAMKDAFTIVVPSYDFYRYLAGACRDELGGKTVITSTAYPDRIQFLSDRGADVIIDAAPMILPQVVEFNVLEAMMLAALEKHQDEVTHDDLLEIMSQERMKPRVVYPSGRPKRTNRFAFVIHPLSQEYLKADRSIRFLTKWAPRKLMNMIEYLVAYAHPWIYSPVSGIESTTGVKAEGWLITVGGTPRQMLSHRPEFTYRRLLKAATMAKRLGAQIMGLGAFTKVVGDAGVTVARRSDLPITTGNSYSASGALWAAADAVRRLGLIEVRPGRRIRAKAMVIGATGSIGSVCCRLLAYAFDDVYMVDVRDARLLALRESIHREAPEATLHISTRADRFLPDMDVIVTATSSAGKRILDITKVKPGCVITDVARPLDLSSDDVAKRPDVLVIESGEIKVPGDVRMRSIGLPPNVVYACMAETIVLALEGRYESFTIGRNIEWESVREVYRMGLTHGMELAAISGVNGIYDDEAIARVREMALEARARETPPVESAQIAKGALV